MVLIYTRFLKKKPNFTQKFLRRNSIFKKTRLHSLAKPKFYINWKSNQLKGKYRKCWIWVNISANELNACINDEVFSIIIFFFNFAFANWYSFPIKTMINSFLFQFQYKAKWNLGIYNWNAETRPDYYTQKLC